MTGHIPILTKISRDADGSEGSSPGPFRNIYRQWQSALAPNRNELSTLLFVNPDHSNPVTLSDDPEKLKSFIVVLNGSEKEKKNLSSKFLKALSDHHIPRCFPDDLPMYLLLVCKLLKMGSPPKPDIKRFVCHFVDMVHSLDSGKAAKVVNKFLERASTIQSEDGTKHIRLYLKDGCMEVLSFVSSEGQFLDHQSVIRCGFVYSRMLWISLILSFSDKDHNFAMSLWSDNLLRYSHQISLDVHIVKEVEQGLKLGSQLKLPIEISFNYHRMASFAIGVMSMRQFAIIIHYLRTVEPYVEDSSQLLEFLAILRNKYSQWLEVATITEICARSMIGKLDGVISESLELVDCIHKVFMKRAFDPKVIEATCHEWIMMFIRIVSFTDDMANYHFKPFLHSEPEVLQMKAIRAEIIMHIYNGMLYASLSTNQFRLLFKLGVFDVNVVEEYLMRYRLPEDVSINDSEWVIFFNEVFSKCNKAKNHSFLITRFLQPALDRYSRVGAERRVTFLSNLLELSHKVPGLFSVDNNCIEDASQMPVNFQEFVRQNLTLDALNYIISKQCQFFETPLPVSKYETNVCGQLILAVVHNFIMEHEVDDPLLQLIHDAVHLLCGNLEWMRVASIKQSFCLSCIVACCAKMQPISGQNSLHIIQSWSEIILEIGCVYYRCCHEKRFTDGGGCTTADGQLQLQMDLNSCPVKEAKRYFRWVEEIQDMLIQLDSDIVHHQVTYHALKAYTKDSKILGRLCSMMCLCVAITNSERILKKMGTECSDFLTKLSKALLKSVPGQPANEFFTIEELLSDCQVSLPHDIRDMIPKHVVYPTRVKELTPGSSSRGNNQPSRDNSVIELHVSERISIGEIGILAGKLVKLDALMDDLTSVVSFFKFHRSRLFRECLNLQNLTKDKEDLPCHVHVDDTILLLRKCDASDTEVGVSVVSLVKALKNVQKQLTKFLAGGAEYVDIVKLHPEKMNIPTEVEILREYSTVFSIECSGLEDTLSMFNLCKLTCQVRDLLFICRQLRLQNCLHDSRVVELVKIVGELEDQDVLSKMTSERALKLTNEMKSVLCFHESSIPQCLHVCSALRVNRIEAFIHLLVDIEDENNIVRCKEIAELAQTEAHVAKEFSSLIHFLKPLLDTDQSFDSFKDHEFAVDDLECGLQVLRHVVKNISLLQQLFSEESTFLLRQEKQSAAKAREESAGLHKEVQRYKSQLQKLVEEKEKIQVAAERLQNESDALSVQNRNLQKLRNALKQQNQSLVEEVQSCKGRIEEVVNEKDTLLNDKSSLLEQNESLHHELNALETKYQQVCLAQPESAAFGIEPWKISRDKIKSGNEVGGGGWGKVQKGKLEVAIKQIHPKILSPLNVARLKREMEMLARVRHPNLLQFIGVVFEEHVDYEKNPPYIITELLDTSLREAYERDKIPDRDSLCSIFQDTARALDYLHRHHEPIIHRDVSSANVLLKRLPNGSWLAKVSDLGSANLARKAYTMNEGAAIYCAPEAITHDTSTHSGVRLSPKMDVYSYGIMLCEVATRKLPAKEHYPLMLILVQKKWPELYRLIIACTKKEARERPSMKDVLSTLTAEPFSSTTQ